MVLRGDEAQVKALSVQLEIVLILTQGRCIVCAEHTIGLEIILDAPDATPRRRETCGMPFWSIWRWVFVLMQDRSMVCAKRTIGSKIILDAPDGTLG